MVTGAGSNSNIIIGNFVGTDFSGTARIGNTLSGVRIAEGASSNTIGGITAADRNVISGNGNTPAAGRHGILIDGLGTNSNVVLGNFVGVDVTGNVALGNLRQGIAITNSAANNIVGGTAAGAANVISGNTVTGVYVQNATGTVIVGNLIGVGADGVTALGNGQDGVTIESSTNTTIGGTNASARNIISANTVYGLRIFGSTSTGNLVQGNYIGLDVTGTLDRGNTSDGVLIELGANSNTIGGSTAARRNVISGNNGDGIEINDSDNTIVIGNYVGLNAAGTGRVQNTLNGVLITNTAISNRIGTDGDGVNDLGERNVISGNASGTMANVNLITSHDNIVAGNYIGTNAAGTGIVTNPGRGVRVATSSINNRIGTDGSNDAFNASERNVIAGHSGNGVYVVGSNQNVVAGNYVGLDATGATVFGNSADGISVELAASNRIGTNADGIADGLEGNVVAGSGGIGIAIINNSTLNVIAGNRVGTNAAGTAAMPNTIGGVVVGANATYNTIGGSGPGAGNLVSGNTGPGVWILRTFNATTYPPSPNNTIQGNIVGLDASGTLALGNAQGILVDEPDTTIGGAADGARNVVSGNLLSGIEIAGTATNVVVQGNYIGTDITGTLDVGNSLDGIRVSNAPGNTIGGTANGARNVISGNDLAGVNITGAASANNNVLGNYIGVDSLGTVAVSNQQGIILSNGANHNTIGGTVANARNLISGNANYGVYLLDVGTQNNSVSGNYIGTNATGTGAIPNQVGVVLTSGASNNMVGGTSVGAGNLISGNSGSAGVYLSAVGTTLNTIAGNLIGTNAAGTAALANADTGITIANGAENNFIGGTSPSTRNVISGNGQSGIYLLASSNFVRGNYIGTDIVGASAIPNVHGIRLQSDFNTIGGANAAERNTISGNLSAGITIPAASDNVILGNFIGTNSTGSLAVGNGFGIEIRDGATRNQIGGAAEGSANVISGNLGSGIQMGHAGAPENIVQGNLIGTDASGSYAIGNLGLGIYLAEAVNNVVGGTSPGEGNTISGNQGGIAIAGAFATGNRVEGNFIGASRNGLGAIPNNLFGVQIENASTGNVIGGAATNAGNYVANNQGAGIRLVGAAANNNTILGNRFNGNLTLAIDAGAAGATLNDGTESDGLLNFPVITSANFVSGNLEIEGFVGPGRTIDIYLSSPTSTGFGQGNQLLFTRVEGSSTLGFADADAGIGLYGPTINGIAVSSGAVSANQFKFVIDLDDLPANVRLGSLLTAVARGSTSEFGNSLIIGEIISALRPVVTLPSSAPSVLPGEEVAISGFFEDLDSSSWTLTVDYGDGSGPQNLAFNPLDRTFNLKHTYASAGNYTITVTAIDNSSQVSLPATVNVTVNNQRPVATFNEFTLTNSVVEGVLTTLQGSFTDEGTESHTVTIEWGDGTTETQTYGAGVRDFLATHRYLDDGATNSQRDFYRVVVTVTDASGASDRTAEGLFLQEVVNSVPSGLLLNVSPSSASENEVVTLDGSFFDPGVLDTHIVSIDWGDGSSPEVLNLSQLNVTSRNFSRTHRYLDNPLSGSNYVITVSVVDDDEPLAPVIATRALVVQNASPNSPAISLNTTSISEGGTIQLGASFTDVGTLDRHEVVINWGDGSEEQVIYLAPGQRTISNVPHQYIDDPSDLNPNYTITVKVRDNDMSAGSYVAATTSVTVSNIPALAPACPTLHAIDSRRVGHGHSRFGNPRRPGSSHFRHIHRSRLARFPYCNRHLVRRQNDHCFGHSKTGYQSTADSRAV